MSTREINLASLMKLKSRLAGEFSRLTTTILRNNCVREDLKPQIQVNVQELFEKRLKIQNCLIFIKVALSQANQAIQQELSSLNEIKGNIDFYKNLIASIDNSIATNNSYYQTLYEDRPSKVVNYVSSYSRENLNKLFEEENRKLFDLQDKIDSFNATKKVLIPEEFLRLI